MWDNMIVPYGHKVLVNVVRAKVIWRVAGDPQVYGTPQVLRGTKVVALSFISDCVCTIVNIGI